MAITYPGSKNNGVDKTELYQKIFKGEVEEAWLNKPVTNGLLTQKTIQSGKSYEFKNSGAGSFTQQWDGVELAGQDDIEFSNTIIVVEPRITSVEKVTEIDSKMNDFNERTVIKNAMVQTLINKYDYDRIREIIIGSRSANKIPTLPGGSEITNADLESTDITLKGEALFDSIFEAKQILAEKNVEEEAYVILAPSEYNALSRLDKIVSKDFTTDNGGFDKGTVIDVAGIKVLQSNNLKRVDSSADTYHGVDATNVYGVVFTMSAVATVDLIGMDTRFVDRKDAYATKIMSSYVSGHGYLRPECAISFKSQ